jgi:hypothetical protein
MKSNFDIIYESVMNDLVYTSAAQFKLKTGPKVQNGLLDKDDTQAILSRYLNIYGRMFPNIFVYTKYPAYNKSIHDIKGFLELCNNEKIYNGGKIQVHFEISGTDFISKRPTAKLSMSFPEGHKIF